jgi:hypothetical protein
MWYRRSASIVQVEKRREEAISDDNVMTFKLEKSDGVLELVTDKPKRWKSSASAGCA